MKSLLVRKKHVTLDQALTAMSDPGVARKDAMAMWRKAVRRANEPTKELLRRASVQAKQTRGGRSHA